MSLINSLYPGRFGGNFAIYFDDWYLPVKLPSCEYSRNSLIKVNIDSTKPLSELLLTEFYVAIRRHMGGVITELHNYAQEIYHTQLQIGIMLLLL